MTLQIGIFYYAYAHCVAGVGRDGGQNVYDIIKFISTKPFSPPQFTKPFNKKDWINALFI